MLETIFIESEQFLPDYKVSNDRGHWLMRTKINNWDLAGDLRRATRACSGGLLCST